MAETIEFTFDCYQNGHRRTCLITFIIFLFTIILFLFSHLLAIQVKDQLNTSNVYLSQSSQCSNINQTRIQYGRKHFSQSRVIICGLIRDREPHISRLKEQLNSIAKFFADYAIVIVENDSKDGTRRELINWANNDRHIHVIGCDNQTNNIHSCNLSLPATVQQYIPKLSRIEKMVQLRNIYMNYVENHSLLKQFDYIIVEDFDLTTTTYLNGFFSTGFYLNNDLTIDAICSNGMFYNKIFSNMITYTSYFDPYAHKDEENQNWGMAYNDVWSTLFRKYSCDDDLVSVQSCFSGRTIYRYKSIQGRRYRTYLDQNQQAICEHVGLHETINKMYLNSEMILYITKNNINK